MANSSTPSPIPFLILGLVTGGALLYVSYWVWPPAQRRNSSSSRSSRRTGRRQASSSRNTGSTGTASHSLRRSNATRRSSTHSQHRNHYQHASRRDEGRNQLSDGSSSDEEPSRARGGHSNDSEEEETTDHEYAALVDEDGYERLRMDDFGDSKHDGLQLMNLLYAIAEDQAGKEGHIHRGITCNSCRTVPIRGLRYKCANCQDYDLCEGCEAAEVHIKSHVFMKIRIPIPPLANSRTKKLPPFYPGIPQGSTTTPDHLLQELLQKTHFDNVELDAMYNQYLSLSTLDQEGGGITRLTFEQALGPLGLEKNLITDRIFRFFDQDDDGIINFKEMAFGLSVLCKGNFDEKIDFAFQGYDLDGDGYISKEELHEMFKAYFYLSMELIRDVVKTMENDLISNFEYQPGMPISSTFTAPIPREIGVRTNNENNSTASSTSPNNHRTAEERRRNREQVPLPAEWPSSDIANDESSSATPATPCSSNDSSQELEDQLAGPRLGSGPMFEQDVAEIADEVSTVTHSALSSGSSGLVGSDTTANSGEDGDDERSGTFTVIDPATPGGEESRAAVLLLPVAVDEVEDRGADSSNWHTQPSSSRGRLASELNNTDEVNSDSCHSPNSSDSSAASFAAVSRENSSGEGSSSRPRKDLPLPAATSSPHMAPPNSSNTNFTWDHPYHSTGSSPSYFRASTTAISLGPSSAIGNVLPQEATSTSPFSSPSSPLSRGNLDGSIGRSATLDSSGRRASLGTPYQPLASSSVAPTGSYANASYFSSTFPVMESISQDAIQEMVDKTFSAIQNPSKPGFITLEEFRAYVLTDAGILGWFDALGSIF